MITPVKKMAVQGSQDEALGVRMWQWPQLSKAPTLNWLKAPRAGSVNDHNLQVANGRWYGLLVVLRY